MSVKTRNSTPLVPKLVIGGVIWLCVAGMSCAEKQPRPLEQSQFIVELQQALPEADLGRLASRWSVNTGQTVQVLRSQGQRVIIRVDQALTPEQKQMLINTLSADPVVNYVESDVMMQPMRPKY